VNIHDGSTCEYVKQAWKEGHEIACHTRDHSSLAGKTFSTI